MNKKITVQHLAQLIEEWAPQELAEEWDNPGLQIGAFTQKVATVLICLDIDLKSFQVIKKIKPDLVITHHPLIFRPIKRLDLESDIGQIFSLFVKNDISLYSAHTNLDVTDGGVTDCLIKAFGLDPDNGSPLEKGVGKIFKVSSPYTKEQITAKFSEVVVSGDLEKQEFKKIAFCGGSGKSLLKKLANLQVDAFVTGELAYHDDLYCEFNALTAFKLGHRESEIFVLPEIKKRLLQKYPNLKITVLS